jgi:thiamine-phosphate pyrophosphorylase
MLHRLQAIIDVDLAERAGWSPRDLARAYLDGGARFLQIRAKALPSGRFLELCDAIVPDAHQAGAIVIINDRVDLARLSGADGAHVGQDDLPVTAARTQLGPDAIIGYSTHTIAQVRQSLELPATYTAVGPVFGTRSKQTGYDAVGLDLVSAAHAVCGTRPIVAIGGITLETAASVVAAGATSVAVISDLLASGDPLSRVREYLRILGAPECRG